MLEKMIDFFEARLDGYDEHMLSNIEFADEFYPFTAKQLPTNENCHILDLETNKLIATPGCFATLSFCKLNDAPFFRLNAAF